jgi:predicted phosphate transport protein (TIGR00153 family)
LRQGGTGTVPAARRQTGLLLGLLPTAIFFFVALVAPTGTTKPAPDRGRVFFTVTLREEGEGRSIVPLSLVPRERQFFVFFRDNANNLMEALRTLDGLLRAQSGDFSEPARRLRDLEHQGDETTHRIANELNTTFITPFDREDIFALAGAIDDVIDLAEETADTIVLDRIDTITAEAQQMGGILVQIGQELVRAFEKLESRKDMAQHWVKIHDLENQGDRVTRQAIGDLFSAADDPFYVIKWKDVYALLEKTVDRTEDIANILESVTIKNA